MQALDKELAQNFAGILRLALVTGMRKGVLLALQWDDIGFGTGGITLRGESAKKGLTDRIPLSDVAKNIIQRVDKTSRPYTFPGKNRQQRKDFSRIARRVRDNTGLLKDFRPLYGLRHTYASLLSSSGKVYLYTLQKLLTHGSPQMIQRYAHPADEALHRATKVADTFLSNQAKVTDER